MNRAGRWIWAALAVTALLLLGGWAVGSWLLAREAVPAVSDYRIDLQEIRRQAASLPGPLPLRVNHELLCETSMPRVAVFAGESFDPHPLAHGAYQVVYPDGFLVIDAGFGPETVEEMAGETEIDAQAYETIQNALGEARSVVLTHEHLDHMDGLASYPDPARLASRLVMTREQLADERAQRILPAALREAVMPLEYEGTVAVAPGVVLLKAAGHTAGSQMIYVRLENGSEWLFLGDVAWHMEAIEKLHYRPRLVTDIFLGEDRAAVMAQFRTLHELAASEPVQLVASHDVDQRKRLIDSGKLGAQFE